MKTAFDFLVEWTENLNWKKYLLNTILQNKNYEIGNIVDELVDIYYTNREIGQIQTRAEGSSEVDLTINEIKFPHNINALSSESTCSLGSKLNVFYGENGTGKSSYVKIFRKLTENYYTMEKNLAVKPNIYINPEEKSSQCITISYNDGEKSYCEECIDINKPHEFLSKINVFDSSSVIPLLNSDLSFRILPIGFIEFVKLTELLDKAKTELTNRSTTLITKQSTIFQDTSYHSIADKIVDITNAIMDLKSIDKIIESKYKLPENYIEDIKTLQSDIKVLENTNQVELIKILSAQKGKLESMKNNLVTLGLHINFDKIQDINSLIKDYNKLLKEERVYNEQFSRSITHVKKLNNKWIEFITHAREYYSSIGLERPVINEACILCGQEYREDQILLIDTCFKHIDSNIAKLRVELENKLKRVNIPELTCRLLKEDELLFPEDKAILIEKLKATLILVENNRNIIVKNIENKSEIEPALSINFEGILKEIEIEVESIDKRLSDLSLSTEKIVALISDLKVKLKDLDDNVKINESKEKFVEWINLKDAINRNNKLKGKLSTNSLTAKASEAFKLIVADEYSATFEKYCKELGVSNVSISLTSQKGTSKRGKYVVNDSIKVTDIMSEGEQKAIALAEFTTDLEIRKNKSTTLFDDPVTSFDYKRAEKIADIIRNMSESRQIIVFTHNIMFYYYLYNSCCNEKNLENKFFKIDEFDRDNKGIISLSAEGRLENLNGVYKKIKNFEQKINSKKCLGDDLEQALKSVYSEIRTWCELIVEEGFFKKVIRRYEPNIMFTYVEKIDSEFIVYLNDVSKLFSKSCRYMIGHSQPVETQNIKPTREEFDSDYNFVSMLTEKYKN